jgi:hypothetical protein
MLVNEVFLMQYYEPLRKFMHLKVKISFQLNEIIVLFRFQTVPFSIPPDIRIFEFIFSPENAYAYVCFGVCKG